MLSQFQKYITKRHLFGTHDHILLAVSGGVDSVVMCYLFYQANLAFAIAHCNFSLRGEASDGDEAFVKTLAQRFQVPFFSIRFQTEREAQERKLSIQMAARELRYEWLEKIRVEAGFDYIATAHHCNDSIETVLYNFAKGCGVRGLHGILPKSGHLVRPLLFATKEEIETFAQTKNIKFRFDASNDSDKYDRNKIRHHVIPVLEELNPNFKQTASENIERLRQTEWLYDFALQTLHKQWVRADEKEIRIFFSELIKSPARRTILYEWLRPYQFNKGQVAQMLEITNFQPGSKFYSPTHELLVDRECLIIRLINEDAQEEFFIQQNDSIFSLNNGILTLNHSVKPPATFPESENVVYLDYDKVEFPLKLRHWQEGDYFYPMGMQGRRQKLQDFFTNQKLSRFDKEAVWIVESGNAICWIVGHRLDERFKLSPETKYCLRLEFQ